MVKSHSIIKIEVATSYAVQKLIEVSSKYHEVAALYTYDSSLASQIEDNVAN